MNPAVTCFCPTRNRRNWLPQAIACFQAQTYENRRMLIVADGGEDVLDLIPRDPRIDYIRHDELQRQATNGDRFNCCCHLASEQHDRAASGSPLILCKWDDDDWSAPNRISDQVERLQATGKTLTGYHTMLFTDGTGWWRYRGAPDFCMGTSLCFTREWWEKHPFRAVQIGSDVLFQAEAAAAKQVATVDAGELMVASIHSRNSSPRNLQSAPFEKVHGYSGPAGWDF